MNKSEPVRGRDGVFLVVTGIGGFLAIGFVGGAMMALAGLGASVGDEDNPVYAILSLTGIALMLVGWVFLFRWLYRESKTSARAGSAESAAAAKDLQETD